MLQGTVGYASARSQHSYLTGIQSLQDSFGGGFVLTTKEEASSFRYITVVCNMSYGSRNSASLAVGNLQETWPSVASRGRGAIPEEIAG